MSLLKSSANEASPRLLIISPNWIGDAVMAQPLLQLLKSQYPPCVIDVLAPTAVAPVWRMMSEVATVLETPFQHGALQLSERWRFARLLRQRAYAAAYILPNTLKYALVPWMAGIKKRIGYKGESRYGLINTMHFDTKAQPRAMVPFYAALAFAPTPQAPAPVPKPRLSVTIEQAQDAFAHVGLSMTKPLVCFAPGAEFGNAKRWPVSHFAELAHKILQDFPEMQIALMGSPKDAAICQEIQQLCPSVHQLAGKTNLQQAVALMSAANVVVSNDSGLLHIASALNRNVMAIYGSTDPDHAPPFSDVAASFSLRLPCAPCKQRECPLGHHDCMQKLDANLLWQPLKPLLASTSQRI
ncbi:lipopolysaccharide heptosyltransferase II [Undibacterium sp. SXout20W]|uniref:lipopolysaccharide heptosyltransferase II n=1 Tax=Undibacterium sp. SXout20W TaxID=3413051 RepID=UPI003BF01ACE